MKLKDLPIQRKLMTVILLTCFLVLLLMGSAYMILEFFSYKQTVKTNVSTLGRIIASNSSASLAFDSPKDATEILNALKEDQDIVLAALYDTTGKVFAVYPQDANPLSFPPVNKNRSYHFEDRFLSGFQVVKQKDKELGTLYLKANLEAMYSQLQHYAVIGILLILGSLAVAYFLSKLLQKNISEPILALEQVAKIISEKRDYSVRAEKTGRDEVGALTDSFNQMLGQIHEQNLKITSFNLELENKVNERTYALEQQRDFVETIINSSVDLLAVFDTNLNYIMLNKRADDFYKMKREDIIGKNIKDVFPHTIGTGMVADLKKAVVGEYIHNASYKSPIAGKFFENYYVPLQNKNNEVYGVLAIGHDITNLIQANEKLKIVNADLVKSNRDLEQFAYVASHDLQEPLRKIQTFTQLMGENVNDPQIILKYYDKIHQSASRMQSLIIDVLNFSRITKTEESFVATDLNQVLENLKVDFELPLKEKNAVINHTSLPVITGIPLQLSQLFSNLISNSLKYNDKNPVIDITSHLLSQEDIHIYPKLDDKIVYTQIDFKDNGIGFEQQFSEKIFDIFQRLHGKQSYSGTGIGLGICKKIVENHHGIIFAKGEPGKGSMFTIILPIDRMLNSEDNPM